jgi:hypothetical protein
MNTKFAQVEISSVEQLRQSVKGGVYLNILEGEETRQGTQQGFLSQNIQRLQNIKAKCGPQNRCSHSYVFAGK